MVNFKGQSKNGGVSAVRYANIAGSHEEVWQKQTVLPSVQTFIDRVKRLSHGHRVVPQNLRVQFIAEVSVELIHNWTLNHRSMSDMRSKTLFSILI